jgi:AraC-like DNA-binding protein
MSLTIGRPCAALAPYVSAYWDYQNLTGGTGSSLSILPDTATHLCFLYQDQLVTAHGGATYRTRSGLAGWQSYRMDLGGDGIISGVSARLTPWGINVFRRGIVRECAERRVDSRDIFPRHAIDLIEDELAGLPSPAARIACIERFLLSIFRPQDEDATVRWACHELQLSRGTRRIAELAQRAGMSQRSLERRFVNTIGATPKRLARVIRLRSAIFQKQRLQSWAMVAHGAGFCDQSHLIRDCLEIYGMTPDALYPRVQVSPTWQFSGLLDLTPPASDFSNTPVSSAR